MEKISQKSETITPDSVSAWGQRICTIQLNQASPEIVSRIRETTARRLRANTACKDARYLERANAVSSASHAVTLQQLSVAPSEIMNHSCEAHSVRSNMLRSNIDSYKARRFARVSNVQYDEEEVEMMLSHVEQNVMQEMQQTRTIFEPTIPGVSVQLGPDLADAVVGLDTLLKTLENEPTEEAEMAAKFQLFENFLDTVTIIREETIAFWEENRDQFIGSSFAECEKEIKAIDNAESMGLNEYERSGRKWFVYYMTKKVNSNNIMITRVLAKLRSRLEIISQELGNCPCCLELMTEGTFMTLGCCHRVCNDCWSQWKKLKEDMGAVPFCPLCKHEEFVQDLMETFAG